LATSVEAAKLKSIEPEAPTPKTIEIPPAKTEVLPTPEPGAPGEAVTAPLPEPRVPAREPGKVRGKTFEGKKKPGFFAKGGYVHNRGSNFLRSRKRAS